METRRQFDADGVVRCGRTRGPSMLMAALCSAAIVWLFTSAPWSRLERPRTDRGDGERALPHSLGKPQSLEPPIQRVLPYPRARWRLASHHELERTVLWFSHILIRYAGVLDPGVSFSLADWHSGYPASRLHRDDALRLAQRVAGEAAEGKVPFADLVAAYSEDITTVDRAGSLGGVTAATLVPWDMILDALAVLKPGEPSGVVESPHGFHILLRRAPPPSGLVSGERIIVGHDDARWLRYFHARVEVPHRSRADAATLAHRLFEMARHNPAEFPALVAGYSEHRDADAGGDLGEWSTHEPSAQAREIETLAQLDIGQVGRPIETLFGFQILMRTPNRQRAIFAHEAVEVLYDPLVPEGQPGFAASARAQAEELGARLEREPHLFDSFRAEICCLGSHLWKQGHQEPSLEAALSLLEIGEIGTRPVRTVSSFALLRRLDPAQVASRQLPVSFELPSPARPDVERFLAFELAPDSVERILRSLASLVADELEAAGSSRSHLLALHELRLDPDDGDARARTVADIFQRGEALLGPGGYDRYTALAARLVEDAVLRPGTDG